MGRYRHAQASIIACWLHQPLSCHVLLYVPHPYRNTDKTPHPDPYSAIHTEKENQGKGGKSTSQSEYKLGSIDSMDIDTEKAIR